MRIAGLVTGGHYFHREIMRQNGAETFEMGSGISRAINEFLKLPRGYDSYITESNFYSPILLEKIIGGRKPKIINIAGSPSIFVSKNPIIERLINEIDIMVVEGQFGFEHIKSRGYKNEVKVVYPFIEHERVRPLTEFKYKPKKDIEITTIARGDWRIKGIDVLLKAIGDMKNVKLNVIGEVNYNTDLKNVVFHEKLGFGQVLKVLKRTSVYVQASRFETFSISSLETMLAGIPTIVSNNCGISEILGERWVFESEDSTNLAGKIDEVLSGNIQSMSAEMKKLGINYVKNICSRKKELKVI